MCMQNKTFSESVEGEAGRFGVPDFEEARDEWEFDGVDWVKRDADGNVWVFDGTEFCVKDADHNLYVEHDGILYSKNVETGELIPFVPEPGEAGAESAEGGPEGGAGEGSANDRNDKKKNGKGGRKGGRDALSDSASESDTSGSDPSGSDRSQADDVNELKEGRRRRRHGKKSRNKGKRGSKGAGAESEKMKLTASQLELYRTYEKLALLNLLDPERSDPMAAAAGDGGGTGGLGGGGVGGGGVGSGGVFGTGSAGLRGGRKPGSRRELMLLLRSQSSRMVSLSECLRQIQHICRRLLRSTQAGTTTETDRTLYLLASTILDVFDPAIVEVDAALAPLRPSLSALLTAPADADLSFFSDAMRRRAVTLLHTRLTACATRIAEVALRSRAAQKIHGSGGACVRNDRISPADNVALRLAIAMQSLLDSVALSVTVETS